MSQTEMIQRQRILLHQADSLMQQLETDRVELKFQLRKVTEERDAETKRADHWQHQFHEMGRVAREAEVKNTSLEQALRGVAGIRDRCCTLSRVQPAHYGSCIHENARSVLSHNPTEGTE